MDRLEPMEVFHSSSSSFHLPPPPPPLPSSISPSSPALSFSSRPSSLSFSSDGSDSSIFPSPISSPIAPIVDYADFEARNSLPLLKAMELKTFWKTCKRKGSRKGRLRRPILTSSLYCQFIATVINSHNPLDLQLGLSKLCHPQVTIIKRIYSFHSENQGLLDIPFSLEEFCHHMNYWFQVLPDGLMDVSSFRPCITSSPMYVFGSVFHYSGTMISNREIDLIHLDHRGLATNPSFSSSPFHNPFNSPKRFQSCGSLAVYVNKEGFITSIELYFENV